LNFPFKWHDGFQKLSFQKQAIAYYKGGYSNLTKVTGAKESFSPNKSDPFLYKDATDTVRLSHGKEGSLIGSSFKSSILWGFF